MDTRDDIAGPRKIEATGMDNSKLRKTMRKMIKRPSKPISKTTAKKIVGAKSCSRKGKKVTGTSKTDSSQRGIREFLFNSNTVIGIKGIGIGMMNSHGNFHGLT